MSIKSKERYFFYALLAASALFCIVLFAPYLTVLLIAAALAVVLHPVHTWLRVRVTRNVSWIAALITLILFIAIIGVPLFFIGSQVVTETRSLYASIAAGNGGFLAHMSQSINALLPAELHIDLQSRLATALSSFSGTIANIFTATLHTIFAILIGALALFYFLKDGERWKKLVVWLSPLSDVHDQRIITMLKQSVNGVMRGYVLIALAQGCLMGFGLWIFGVPNPILWGVLAGIASMIPSIGTSLVAVPAIIFLFLTAPIGVALGFTAWAAVLVGGIDNILNPIIVGKKVDLPPLVILFSVLGGIALLGPSGIVIGPLAVSLLHTLTQIYKEDFETRETE